MFSKVIDFMTKILVCDSISDSGLSKLKESSLDFSFEPNITPSELLRKIGDYEAIIVRSRTRVTKEVLEKGKKLKVVGRAGVGLDNVDLTTARVRGVKVFNTPDALTNAVAEFTIALMLDLSRKITLSDSSMRQAKWIKNSLLGEELKGKTYGTIGIGRIGARVSELAHALGMKIMANDVIPVPQALIDKFGVRVSTQDEIFERADYVDLHVPLTTETTYLVNYDKLCKMKKSAFLINTSRGKVVNEVDLLRALEENRIGGAALDVFEVEPLASKELRASEKVILTPHIAGQSRQAQDESGRMVVELVLEALG